MERSTGQHDSKSKIENKQFTKETNLNLGRPCKSCGNSTGRNDDICERCNTWLLDGQCCFCYKPVKPDQKFCGHCGNTPKGIICPNCNEPSHFHFCPKCDAPLSKSALPALTQLRNSPEIKDIRSLLKDNTIVPTIVETETDKPNKDQQEQLLNYMKQYELNKENQTNTPNTSYFQFKNETKDFGENIQKSNESAASIINEAKIKANSEIINQKIKELQDRLFEDNQSAREFYTALKITLPEIKKCTKILGWQCNYVNFIHFRGPSDCACPEKGGRWVCEDDTQWVTDSSFIFEGQTYTVTDKDERGFYL